MKKNKLSNYGKVFQEYKGKGKLFLKNGLELNCRFSTAQFTDANLYTICEIAKKDFGKVFEPSEAKLFGKTKDGKTITSANLHCIKNNTYHSSNARFQSMVFRGSELVVENSSTIKGRVRFQFFLSNLDLAGQELNFNLNGFKIILSPVQNYREIIDNIKAQKIDTTYETKIEADYSEKEKIIEMIDNFCLLLTLAQGCFVSWISYKVNDFNDDELCIYKNVITKPYGTLRLISSIPKKNTEDFINSAYPNFQSCEQDWELRKAIFAYNDAKIETDFLEFRALKMAIVLEHLKGIYLRKHNLQPSFRNAIKDIYSHIKLNLHTTDTKVVDIRNNLVHQMSFNSNFGSEWEQYTFLTTFVGKILLAILTYKGKLYDWADPNIAEIDLDVGY